MSDARMDESVDPLYSCPDSNFVTAKIPEVTVAQQVTECISAVRQRPEALAGQYPCDETEWLPSVTVPRRLGFQLASVSLAQVTNSPAQCLNSGLNRKSIC